MISVRYKEGENGRLAGLSKEMMCILLDLLGSSVIWLYTYARQLADFCKFSLLSSYTFACKFPVETATRLADGMRPPAVVQLLHTAGRSRGSAPYFTALYGFALATCEILQTLFIFTGALLAFILQLHYPT